MSEPATRLLRLLSLFQARARWSGPELAERLGVTARTVRRDVDRLRALGYAVDAAPGVDGGYQLGDGGRLPPLLLDDDEAVAVAVSLGTSTGGAVEGIEEAGLAALAKIDRLLPVHLRHRVGALRGATVNLGPSGDPVKPEVLVAMAHAIAANERMVLRYRSREDRTSERRVDPYRLGTTGRRWYLVARDVDRDAWRTFRVDRTETAIGTGHRFEPTEPADGIDLDTLLRQSITTSPYRFRAEVVVDLPAAALRTRIPPAVGVVRAHPDDPGRSVLRVGSDSLDAMAAHLVALDAPFDVLEPPELRQRIDRLADDLQLVRQRRLGKASRLRRR